MGGRGGQARGVHGAGDGQQQRSEGHEHEGSQRSHRAAVREEFLPNGDVSARTPSGTPTPPYRCTTAARPGSRRSRMRTRTYRRGRIVDSRAARWTAVAAVLAATGALTATIVSSGCKGTADASTTPGQFLAIEKGAPNVVTPEAGRSASVGRFVVDCGTNGNGKFSPDNPVAQPGIKNGAEHLHDIVGNLAITANSSNADLNASGTTCRNGDKSSNFWPVLRFDRTNRAGSSQIQAALADTSPTVACPS